MKSAALGLVFGWVALGLVSGCREEAADSAGDGAPAGLVLTPSSVEATRTPASCGVTEPPYSVKDHFTLEVVGTDDAPARGTLTLQLAATVTTGQATALTVGLDASPNEPDSAVDVSPTIAASSDAAIELSLAFVERSSEIDASGLVSAQVTVDAMPTADGQPLAAEVHLSFVDGRELDQTYTAPVRSAEVLCPP